MVFRAGLALIFTSYGKRRSWCSN